MSTTLLQARAQLASDSGVEGHKDFPEPLLNRYLNLAQKYVQKVLNGLGMKQWEKGYDCAGLLNDSSYYGKPVKTLDLAELIANADYDISVQPNSIRLLETGNGAQKASSSVFGIAKIADEQVFHKILENPYSTPTVKEARFMWQDSTLVISPATVTWVKAHVYAVVKDLVSDTQVFEVPDEFIEQVIKRAKIDIMDKMKQLQNKDEAIQALDKEIKDQYQAYYNTITQKPNEDNMSKLQ